MDEDVKGRELWKRRKWLLVTRREWGMDGIRDWRWLGDWRRLFHVDRRELELGVGMV